MFKKIVAFALSLTMMLTLLPVTSSEGVANFDTKVNAAINKSIYKSVEAAGIEARSKIYDHKSKVVVRVKSKSNDPQSLYEKLAEVIYAETSNPNEGDYMKWDVDDSEVEFAATKSGSYYYYVFTFSMTYLTSRVKRDKLDEKVKKLIKKFNFTNKTPTYEKVKTVYDYVCNNVTYAKSSKRSVYTAYSALIKKKAVCQGFATLLYKIYKTMGISTRVIAGDSTFSGNKHGWNIVKIGKYYYNMDATWDSTLTHAGKKYQYFLKGDSFKGHQRWARYTGLWFYYLYPMSSKSYKLKKAVKASKKSKIAKFIFKKPKITKINRSKVVIKKVSGANYQVKYSKSKSFKKAYSTLVDTQKKTYKFIGLQKGVKYYVKVRACKKIGKKLYYTKWSKKRTV